MLSRRQVVRGLVGLTVVGGGRWTGTAAPAVRPPHRPTLHGSLNKASFASLVGETFAVAGTADSVGMQLIRIDDGPSSAVSEQFSLVFRARRDAELPDGAHTVEHRTAGRTTLFLQQAREEGRYRYYQAPFNLLG